MYRFYDKNGVLLSRDFRLLSSVSNSAWENLQIPTFEANTNGNLEVFVFNESNVNVWFDDIQIQHIPTLISQENHYYAFGLNAKEIEKEGNVNNRFQYNSKEKESFQGLEWNDYGARNYDSEVGRWWGVDALSEKFENFSSYHYAYNNPIITIDPDGNENIVVVGGVDGVGRDRYKFINSGWLQARKYYDKEPLEQTTMVVMTANMTGDDVKYLIEKVLDGDMGISLKFCSSSDELVDYVNKKNADGGLFSDNNDTRSKDKITDMAFFGHGTLDYGFDAGYGHNDREKFGMNEKTIKKLDKDAFSDNSLVGFYTCNAATKTFAKEFSEKTRGYVFGWNGQTSYSGIYNNPQFPDMDYVSYGLLRLRMVYHPQRYLIRVADNLPMGGKDRKKDKTLPQKINYYNGKEKK